MENENYSGEKDVGKGEGKREVIEEDKDSCLNERERVSENRQLIENRKKWWYTQNVFSRAGMIKRILCWEILLYFVTVVLCIYVSSTNGGNPICPSSLKYLALLLNLFCLLKVLPGVACLMAQIPKPAIQLLLIPRTVAAIGIVSILLISLVTSFLYFGELGAFLPKLIILSIIMMTCPFEGYFIMGLKSYAVRPPEESELQGDHSTSKVVVADQPNFVPSQQQPANMQMAYIGQPVPQQQNYVPQIQQSTYQQQNIQPKEP